MNDPGFTEEQKLYLEGFTSGFEIAKKYRGLPGLTGPASASSSVTTGTAGPEAIHINAQNRFLAAGKQLVTEEKAKRERHPLDRWDEFLKRAEAGEFPKGTDVFCTKFFGLFYVAPAQDSYMCRLRLPNGILNVHQLRGVADLAERFGGGYSHVTTRANLQVREISARDGPAFLMGLYELGIVNRGAGADNIRNITGSPTTGIDPQEFIDTFPLTRALHHYILNHRELYGLPRKFNIAFDGGGRISVLEDTNDIGFAAVRIPEGKTVPPGVYFRVQLGGITGHKDFARDAGVVITPEQCIPVAAAIVRVFIDRGDRTDRTRARMKYVLDHIGIEEYLKETEKYLGYALPRIPLNDCEHPPAAQRNAHIGFHPQKQTEMFYVGVALPVGKLTVAQMRGLADIAERFGSGTIRLTVWQNLLISDIRAADIDAVKQAIESLGLHWSASSIRAGLIACTGSTGCKFSAANTKYHAERIAEHIEQRIVFDQPVNIHLTGCHHSCAQHYIGDIGLLACKVSLDDEQEVEGYHLYAGGGYGSDRHLAVEIRRNIPAGEAPEVIERLLHVYLANRRDQNESFAEFSRRHTAEELAHYTVTEPAALPRGVAAG
ncbi:MAG: NirA family protein [Gammaproteobacteria bacterium]|nr:NirA family protein [Gammaproteobacteria bacterium]